MVLISLHRSVKPEPQILSVPQAPRPAPLKRNERIRLFKTAQTAQSSPARTIIGESAIQTARAKPQSAAPVFAEAAQLESQPGNEEEPNRATRTGWSRIFAFLRGN